MGVRKAQKAGGGGMEWVLVGAEGNGSLEAECAGAASGLKWTWVGMCVGSALVNVASAGLLWGLARECRGLGWANDEVLDASMGLVRQALRVAIPRRVVEAVKKIIPDPKAAIAKRLTRANKQAKQAKLPSQT